MKLINFASQLGVFAGLSVALPSESHGSLGEQLVASLKTDISAVHSDQLFLAFSGKEVRQKSAEIVSALDSGLPLVFSDLAGVEKKWVMSHLPISHDNEGGSALLVVDKFHDLNGGHHYRLFNLPSGQDPSQMTDKEDYTNATMIHKVVVSPVERSHEKVPAYTDAAALKRVEGSEGFSVLTREILDDIATYLGKCGGKNVDIVQCHYFMHSAQNFGNQETREAFKQQVDSSDDKEGASTMVPEKEAVWREVIETSYKYWESKWGKPFPFDKAQGVSHRINSYWYMYAQAPPYQEMFYVFLMVDGLHNPNTQLWSTTAVGLYLSNLELDLSATRHNGVVDRDNIFWIKSSPPTQNTQHVIGRSWSSTDSYSLNMNLGFKGKEFYGDVKFNYTKSFTASYSETREITDWSVAENTDPVAGRGKWRYFQQWPVDMLVHNLNDFGKEWELYFEKSWNPCRVKDVPNLSKFALGTHNTMVWAVNPKLKGQDGNLLPVKFSLEFYPRLSAHTCEVYDGHHKLGQVWIDFKDMQWTIRVADLNNIEKQ